MALSFVARGNGEKRVGNQKREIRRKTRRRFGKISVKVPRSLKEFRQHFSKVNCSRVR